MVYLNTLEALNVVQVQHIVDCHTNYTQVVILQDLDKPMEQATGTTLEYNWWYNCSFIWILLFSTIITYHKFNCWKTEYDGMDISNI